MNEIKVTEGNVICGFEEAKAYLEKKLKDYEGLVFTEDTKVEAKKTMAELRKEKKAFQDACKDAKKDYMKPFDAFMEKALELTAMYDRPIYFINSQVTAFEEKRIAEKNARVKVLYEEMIPEEDLQEIIPLQRIIDSKWLNSTATEKSIKASMMEYKENAKKAIEAIKNMHSDMEQRAFEIYKKSLDLAEALMYLTNYEAEKAAILAREAEAMSKAEETKIRQEVRSEILKEEAHKEEVQNAKEEVLNAFIDASNSDDVQPYTYTIFLTKETKGKFEFFLDNAAYDYFIKED